MKTCPSGKRMYISQQLAEDALLEAHGRSHFKPNEGPVNVYSCDDCGQYHLTSRGPMLPRLADALAAGTLQRQRTAHDWEQKFRRK